MEIKHKAEYGIYDTNKIKYLFVSNDPWLVKFAFEYLNIGDIPSLKKESTFHIKCGSICVC